MLASVTRVLCCIAIGYIVIGYTCSVLYNYRVCWGVTRVLCCVAILYGGVCYTCSVLHIYGIFWHLIPMFQVV